MQRIRQSDSPKFRALAVVCCGGIGASPDAPPAAKRTAIVVPPEPNRYATKAVGFVMLSPRFTSGLAFLVFAAACNSSPGVETEALQSVAAPKTMGAIFVERASVDAESPDASHVTARAVFARFSGMEADQVLAVLGFPATGELEQCRRASHEEPPADIDAEIALLDVGRIQLSSGGSETTLAQRTFPELGQVGAGVFYAGGATSSVAQGPQPLAFRAEGSGEAGGFTTQGSMPPPVQGVRIDGVPLEAGWLLTGGSDAEVSWQRATFRDQIEIEVRSESDAFLCVAEDDGSFTLRGALLAELRSDPHATIVVRRVHTQRFDGPFDTSQLRLAERSSPLPLTLE